MLDMKLLKYKMFRQKHQKREKSIRDHRALLVNTSAQQLGGTLFESSSEKHYFFQFLALKFQNLQKHAPLGKCAHLIKPTHAA